MAEGIAEILPGDHRFCVVGFSYGGRLASEIALLLLDRVKALVVVAPGGLGIADVVGRAAR